MHTSEWVLFRKFQSLLSTVFQLMLNTVFQLVCRVLCLTGAVTRLDSIALFARESVDAQHCRSSLNRLSVSNQTRKFIYLIWTMYYVPGTCAICRTSSPLRTGNRHVLIHPGEFFSSAVYSVPACTCCVEPLHRCGLESGDTGWFTPINRSV